jgi:hypothetical protein
MDFSEYVVGAEVKFEAYPTSTGSITPRWNCDHDRGSKRICLWMRGRIYHITKADVIMEFEEAPGQKCLWDWPLDDYIFKRLIVIPAAPIETEQPEDRFLLIGD